VSDTTVVYIAGCGRSGSTVLDLSLGRTEGWHSMGEFRLFWHAIRDQWRCACGESVAGCPFWSDVVASAQCDAPDVLTDLRTTVRMRRIPALMHPALLGSHRGARDRLGTCLREVYAGAAAKAGASVLIDSSKDSIYGLLLASTLDMRIHVVHLVRDSRAVAWSWQRKMKRPEIAHKDAYMPTRSALRAGIDWNLRNSLVHLLRRRASGYTRVSYEAFATEPAATVDLIRAAVTGAPVPAETGSETPGAVDRVNHTVAGNPIRFSAEALELRPDLQWHDALPRRDRRLVTAVTWPLLRRYGYI
jgi:hypothetical protein